MLTEEILFGITSHLSSKVHDKARENHAQIITREHFTKAADKDNAIKNHLARDIIINRINYDV